LRRSDYKNGISTKELSQDCHKKAPGKKRELRNLRRYSVPLTINHPKQVNIAADGGQQVNAMKVDE